MQKKRESQGDLSNVSLLHVIGKQHATSYTFSSVNSFTYCNTSNDR